MKTILDIFKLLISVFAMWIMLYIPISVADTSSDPFTDGVEIIKEFFSSMQTEPGQANLQAKADQNSSPAYAAFKQNSVKPAKQAAKKSNQVNVGFEDLSSGNKKIAQALFNAQPNMDKTSNYPLRSMNKNWSLDEIASANEQLNSWGLVFNLMKEENLIKEDNLGQVIRNHSDIIKSKSRSDDNFNNDTRYKKPEAIVITNAKGEFVVINRSGANGPGSL